MTRPQIFGLLCNLVTHFSKVIGSVPGAARRISPVTLLLDGSERLVVRLVSQVSNLN